MKKTIEIIWSVAALALFLWVCSPADGAELPDFRKLPHFMQHNKCAPLRTEALAALHARGIPARQVNYRWRSLGGEAGYHVAVLFQHEGAFWFFDNGTSKPHKVTAKTDRGCVLQMTDRDVFVQLLDPNHDRKADELMADLFKPAPQWMGELQAGAK